MNTSPDIPRQTFGRRMKIGLALLIFAIIMLLGVGGFMHFERMSLLEAVFAVVVVITTLGLNSMDKISRLSSPGMLITIILALTGWVAIACLASIFIQKGIASDLKIFVARLLGKDAGNGMKASRSTRNSRAPRNLTRRRLQIYLALLFLLMVILIGITGFMFFERMSPLEAFFTTIIILTTIGLSGTEKIAHLSPSGMVFTIILALTGLATVTYAASFLVREIIAGELNTFLGRRIMERQLAALKDHFILCGFGRIGKIIAQEMRDSKTPLVVIENKPDRAGELECDGYLSVHGNAMDDATLELAGIRRARGLISTLDSDADNVFLILSARQMNPNIHLVVRSESDSAIEKLRRVGASAVISPLTMGGEIIAQAALRPNVVEFLTATTRGRYDRYQIEEVPVAEQSALKDRSLKELGIAREHGIMIIGVRRKTEAESIFNPSADTVIRAGDILIILGERANVSLFMGHARG